MAFCESADEHPRILSVETLNAHLPAAPVLVVIPTYNERENIEAILRALDVPGVACDVMVVDDGSPDGTADAAAAIAPTLPRRVRLMRRKGKFGLGVAYLDAHRWIAGHWPEVRYIVQMDADFSHDPRMLPALVREAEAYGVALGSRHVAGGSAPDWSRRRLLLSWCAETYLKIVLKLFFPAYPVRDNTSGFIAWRRDVLERVLHYSIPGDGYSFLTSLKLVVYLAGYPPREVPIVLHDRQHGVSKLDVRIVLEALKMPWKLGWTFRGSASNAAPPPAVSESAASHDGIEM